MQACLCNYTVRYHTGDSDYAEASVPAVLVEIKTVLEGIVNLFCMGLYRESGEQS